MEPIIIDKTVFDSGVEMAYHILLTYPRILTICTTLQGIRKYLASLEDIVCKWYVVNILLEMQDTTRQRLASNLAPYSTSTYEELIDRIKSLSVCPHVLLQDEYYDLAEIVPLDLYKQDGKSLLELLQSKSYVNIVRVLDSISFNLISILDKDIAKAKKPKKILIDTQNVGYNKTQDIITNLLRIERQQSIVERNIQTDPKVFNKNKEFEELLMMAKTICGDTYDKCSHAAEAVFCIECNNRYAIPSTWKARLVENVDNIVKMIGTDNTSVNTSLTKILKDQVCIHCTLLDVRKCDVCGFRYKRYEFCPCWLFGVIIHNDRKKVQRKFNSIVLVPDNHIDRINVNLLQQLSVRYPITDCLSLRQSTTTQQRTKEVIAEENKLLRYSIACIVGALWTMGGVRSDSNIVIDERRLVDNEVNRTRLLHYYHQYCYNISKDYGKQYWNKLTSVTNYVDKVNWSNGITGFI